jgi:2-phospho-L-lactate guanylyltransferase
LRAAVTAIVPIRSFNGMTRLSTELTPDERRSLSENLADSVVDAALASGLDVVVVSDDPDVRAWARTKKVQPVDDRGSGLSDSVSGAVSDLEGGPWIVLHADLPLVNPTVLTAIARKVETGGSVVCPSLDGGTNVIGGWGPFTFEYGPGSFTRHLAQLPDARVLVELALAIEVDTVDHYRALSKLGYLPRVAS